MAEQLYEYLVLYKIGGQGDPEVWHPGSKIKLTADRAAAYLAAGLVREIETSTPLPQPEATTVVHVAEPAVVAEAPKRKGKGD
jgi:hypothetical protein